MPLIGSLNLCLQVGQSPLHSLNVFFVRVTPHSPATICMAQGVQSKGSCTPVLIVDEAQGLSLELEEIRLLLNLETASEKLLQIVLVGKPELVPEPNLTAKVARTFWPRLFWPALLSFFQWPLLWEDSF